MVSPGAMLPARTRDVQDRSGADSGRWTWPLGEVQLRCQQWQHRRAAIRLTGRDGHECRCEYEGGKMSVRVGDGRAKSGGADRRAAQGGEVYSDLGVHSKSLAVTYLAGCGHRAARRHGHPTPTSARARSPARPSQSHGVRGVLSRSSMFCSRDEVRFDAVGDTADAECAEWKLELRAKLWRAPGTGHQGLFQMEPQNAAVLLARESCKNRRGRPVGTLRTE